MSGHDTVSREASNAFQKQIDYLRNVAGFSWGQIVVKAKIPQVGNRSGDTESRVQSMATGSRKPDPETAAAIESLYVRIKTDDVMEEAGVREPSDRYSAPVQKRVRDFNRRFFALYHVYGLTRQEIAEGLGYEAVESVSNILRKGGAKRVSPDRAQKMKSFYTDVQDREIVRVRENGTPEKAKPIESATKPPKPEPPAKDSWDQIKADLLEVADRIVKLGQSHMDGLGDDLPASMRDDFLGVYRKRHDHLVSFIEEDLE